MKKDKFFEKMDNLGLALTYDDVRLKTGYSEVMPHEVSLATKFSRNIPMRVPVVSAAMDTVTGPTLAIELARLGGLGVLHRLFNPDDQAKAVSRVKNHLNARIDDPTCVKASDSIEDIMRMRAERELTFHTFPVLDSEGKLVGLLTQNDFDFCDQLSKKAEEVMTTHLLTSSLETSLDEAYKLMKKHKKKVLPLVDSNNQIRSLYVFSDVNRVKSGESLNYNLDDNGQLRVAVASGTGKDGMERAEKCIKANADVVVVDTAHGDSKPVFDMLQELKGAFPNKDVVIGNISEPESVVRLAEAGADGIKIGQGPGCFAAGTRVLMANGFYKNIEKIEAGDWVIGGKGSPVRVKKAWCTGTREVISVKNTQFYKNTIVTSDHRYWVGDLNSVSRTTVASRGYKRLLEQPTRTGESKFKWKALEDIKQDVPLMPRNIQFDLPKSFKVELLKRKSGNGLNGLEGFEVDTIMEPSYELGYTFGLFLGDGSAHTAEYKGSNIGSVRWYLSPNEAHLCDKLVTCLRKSFPNASMPKVVSPCEKSNIFRVRLYYKPLADFLATFGKKSEKALPENLLANHPEYLQGLYDGLMDSDGHVESNGREVFTSTSPRLIELYNILSYKTKGAFPHNGPHMQGAGGLKGCNEENCAPSFRAKLAITFERRLTEDYQICKWTDFETIDGAVDVYDIEVESDEHSFIAENSIVHNSICTTRVIAGIGSPQVSAVYKCAKAAEHFGIPVCADGGLRYSGDLTIAIGAGAHSVMMGSMLAGTEEAPGRKVFFKGRQWKSYRGMGSMGAMLASRSSRERYRQQSSADDKLIPEGVEGLVPYKGRLQDVLHQYIGGLRAGMGYVGASNVEELRQKADFHRVTHAGKAESHPHDIQITKESPNYPGNTNKSNS